MTRPGAPQADPDRALVLGWLREEEDARLTALWERADAARRAAVGDAVHLRGLVELSNRCVRRCAYCGIRSGRRIQRYRMRADEILACAHDCVALGYGTIVLQAGEDPEITSEWLADVVRRVKAETPLAVTLSLGERTTTELAAWREAGADRYLLRFETSNRALYERIHPPAPGRPAVDRIALLGVLARLGYEVGSGVLVGIPGQTWDDLADDLALFRSLDLDMIGVGPWVPHPDTPLAREASALAAPAGAQVPATDRVTYRVLALARLLCPRANIPSTTAIATVNQLEGRALALRRGANVVMPNVTPLRYRRCYEIYPAKAGSGADDGDAMDREIRATLRALGRSVGTGRGDAPGSRGAPHGAATRTGVGR